jgi:hypothetical protein
MRLQAGQFLYTKAELLPFCTILYRFLFGLLTRNTNKCHFFLSAMLWFRKWHLLINSFAIVSIYSTIYDIVLKCFMSEMNYVCRVRLLFCKINAVCVIFFLLCFAVYIFMNESSINFSMFPKSAKLSCNNLLELCDFVSCSKLWRISWAWDGFLTL